MYGDISAITQVNRDKPTVEAIITRTQWHTQLINGSDYPLPGVMPVISTRNFVNWGFLKQEDAVILTQIRRYNPLLFDFALKRTIKINNAMLPPMVFHSRRVFE